MVRNTLCPYIRSVMPASHEEGETVMAPLFMRFPEDERAALITDAYMFGPDLLVVPVMYAGMRERMEHIHNVFFIPDSGSHAFSGKKKGI